MIGKNEKPSWFVGIAGIINLLIFSTFLILYFKNVSIGEWIAKENYSDKGEWLKQIGLFIITMGGFGYIISTFVDLFCYLPLFHKRKEIGYKTKI